MRDHSDGRSLTQSLSRTLEALARGGPPPAPRQEGLSPGPAAMALGAVALGLLVLGFATGHPALILLALAAAGGGGFLALPVARRLLPELSGRAGEAQAHVGMGATVAADAVLEPGSSVEMGATVGARALVRAGAVVRMGADVGSEAVLEKGVVVSWGATVQAGAVIGEGAIVGAGSDVLRGARVPRGLWVRPGATYGGASAEPARQTIPPPVAPQADPRDARVAAACDKLEAEQRAAPEVLRSFLGGSDETIALLRRTCQDLARRERNLRAEADPAALAQLASERAALGQRIAAERDEAIAQSLRGAVAALDEQRRQRELVLLAADRLQAEHTRLLYTLEGLASQFVRLRAAGTGGGPAPTELEQGVAQLRSELEAIADALDEVARGTPSGLYEAPVAAEERQRPGASRTRA